MDSKCIYDAVIVGGGLSGLMAGISLQKSGYKTIIVEKRSETGGLCGTFTLDGREFIIACNDFGKSIEQYFKALQIPQAFKPVKMKLHFSFGEMVFPLRGSAFNLLKFTPDIIRLVKAANAIKKGTLSYVYLAELINNHCKNEDFKDLLYTTVYGAGTPAELLRLDDIVATLFNKELNYGYNETVVPIGGLGKMVDNMTRYFKVLGGMLILETAVTHSSKIYDNLHEINLSNGKILTSKTLLSSKGRLDQYSGKFQSGLKLGMLHLSVHNSFKFPDSFHTMAYMPKGINDWFSQFHEGMFPVQFGFHFVKSELQNHGDSYGITAYHYVPRGIEVISEGQKKIIRDYIIEKMNVCLSGIKEAVIYEKHLDPAAFTKVHEGLSSVLFAKMMEGDFEKPEIYDEKNDTYFIGNTVNPPGEHACGAMLSGLKAAEMVVDRLKRLDEH